MTGGLNVLLKQAADRVLNTPSYTISSFRGGDTEVNVINPLFQTLADNLKRNYTSISFDKAIELSTGTYIDANGETKVGASRDQRFKDLTAWNKRIAEDYKTELNELLKEEAVEAKARAKVTKEPSGSYIDENVPLNEGTSTWREPHNFYDIEKAIREGSFKKAKKIAEELTNLKAGRLGQITFRRNLVKERLSKLRGAETSLIEKDKIRRELLLYAIAIEGGNLYNAEAIKRGSINIADTEIKIEDKEALQDLALVYPLISKKRLQELATQKDPPAADIFELYNALFDTNLQEGVEADDLQVAEFINQTKKLYE